MKYILATTTLVLAIVGFSTFSYAQTPKTPVVAPAPTLFDANASAPLSVRKQLVDTNLRDLLVRLDTILTRVEVASARLQNNGINTTPADSALITAKTALVTAKTQLDIFSATVVDEKPATVITLRSHAKSAEDNLKLARTSIIESLATLKITLQTQ
ncbi:hypothetical protein K2Q02_02230 [Patescibacteria group bacterium]|nr:hypothetical protein [Patescibacteria group bacterium]